MRLAARAASLLIGLALAACGGASEGPAEPSRTLHRGNTAEPGTLDPHKAGGQWESQIITDIFEGLLVYDIDATPVPGLATSWTTSEDGLVWTFELATDRVWSDGAPITSDDVVFSLRRTLGPATLNQYAAVMYPIRNGRAVNAGETPLEDLGVRAEGPHRVVIELEYPAPFLTEILATAWTSIVPMHVVKAHGDDWIRPEHFVGSGSYVLKEWRVGDYVRAEASPTWPGAEEMCFREVLYYPTTDEAAAARRVRAGELDLNMSFPPDQKALLEAELPGSVRLYPSRTTFWLLTNARTAPFSDVRVREAIGLSMDNRFIVDKVMDGIGIPAVRITPPGLGGTTDAPAVDYAALSMNERRARATNLLEQAGFGPQNPLRFELKYPNNSLWQRVLPVVQADLQAIAPWVQVNLASTETQALYDQLGVGGFEAAVAGWAADYNDAKNFLKLFDSRTAGLNQTGWSDPAVDDLLDAADAEADGAARAAILAEAEQRVLDAFAVAPLHHVVNRALVPSRITGWADNTTRIHPTRFLCADA